MNKRALAPAIALLAAIVATHVIDFTGGYRVFLLSILLFPAALIPELAAIFFVVWLALELIPIRGNRVFLRGICSIALALILGVACLQILRIPSFLFGFAYQVRRIAAPEQIEQTAMKCLELLPAGGTIGAPRAFLREPKDEALWSLLPHHDFLRLGDDTCMIYVDPPRVEFGWGGALIGHTGIRYSADANSRRSWDYASLRWNQRITFYKSP